MAVAEKPLYYLTIHEAQQLIKNRELSPVELTRSVLDRIQAVDGKLHAYINLMAERAMLDARQAEREIQQGKWRGPRSEEHTSELQSRGLISYAVFCLKKKQNTQTVRRLIGERGPTLET